MFAPQRQGTGAGGNACQRAHACLVSRLPTQVVDGWPADSMRTQQGGGNANSKIENVTRGYHTHQ